MPDPIPTILCALAYLTALTLLIVFRGRPPVSWGVAIGLLLVVPCVTALKLAHGNQSSGLAGFLAVLPAALPSALPALPACGAPAIGKWLNDSRPVTWGVVSCVLTTGVLMTTVMSVDLRADAVNSLGLLFGPVLVWVAGVILGLLGAGAGLIVSRGKRRAASA